MPSSALVPQYLRRYCKAQDYGHYTPREHATWRYILRQASAYFAEHAVPSYLDGLKRTGISIEKIPSVENMDRCLKNIGWGAVGVSGFIPPAAFLDFQARSIMPIAMDMRTLEHVAYTPAPDIVHEAAGHLPVLVEPSYRKYLSQYANMAKKAIISREDIELYEAIRALSDIKENPDTKPSDIEAAQAHLNATSAKISHTTELAKVARMNWWTAEYGLVGDLKDPKIYGAGLLSSVGESRYCLTDKVKKLRLSIQCVEQGYDITEPQPQLFVAETLEQLPEVLEELDRTLSYRKGGTEALRNALASKTVNTLVFENGFSASGIVETVVEEKGKLVFFKLNGASQLSHGENQLPGQGRERHSHGFSSPVGRWKIYPDRAPSSLSDAELEAKGLRKGQKCKLEFVSGFTVEGELFNWIRKNQLGVLQWKNCTVKKGSEVYFKPEWGEFDLLVGETAVSVHGGPADREHYGDYDLGTIGTSPGRTSPYTEKEKKVFEFYKEIETERTSHRWDTGGFKSFASRVEETAPDEWLLDLELLELTKEAKAKVLDPIWIQALEKRLLGKAQRLGPVVTDLARQGLMLKDVR